MSRVLSCGAALLLTLTSSLELRAQAETPGTLLKTGDAVPTFSVQTIDGATLNTKSLQGTGKKLLVLFFSTYCKACRAELRYFSEHLDAKKSKGLIVVAVGRDNSDEELREFRRVEKLDFQFVSDPERALFKHFATSQVPRTYLFDKRSKLIHQTRNFLEEECAEVVRRIADGS